MSRPFNQETPLGQLMVREGMAVKEVEARTGISYRTISDYLAARKLPTAKHMILLCDLFGVSRDQMLGEVGLDDDPRAVVAEPADHTHIAGHLRRLGVSA